MKSLNSNTIRYTFSISPVLEAHITLLADAIGGTHGDVYKNAILLYKFAVEAKREGKRLFLRDEDGVETEIVGFDRVPEAREATGR